MTGRFPARIVSFLPTTRQMTMNLLVAAGSSAEEVGVVSPAGYRHNSTRSNPTKSNVTPGKSDPTNRSCGSHDFAQLAVQIQSHQGSSEPSELQLHQGPEAESAEPRTTHNNPGTMQARPTQLSRKPTKPNSCPIHSNPTQPNPNQPNSTQSSPTHSNPTQANSIIDPNVTTLRVQFGRSTVPGRGLV